MINIIIQENVTPEAKSILATQLQKLALTLMGDIIVEYCAEYLKDDEHLDKDIEFGKYLQQFFIDIPTINEPKTMAHCFIFTYRYIKSQEIFTLSAEAIHMLLNVAKYKQNYYKNNVSHKLINITGSVVNAEPPYEYVLSKDNLPLLIRNVIWPQENKWVIYDSLHTDAHIEDKATIMKIISSYELVSEFYDTLSKCRFA